jgi:hypothetical protein
MGDALSHRRVARAIPGRAALGQTRSPASVDGLLDLRVRAKCAPGITADVPSPETFHPAIAWGQCIVRRGSVTLPVIFLATLLGECSARLAMTLFYSHPL